MSPIASDMGGATHDHLCGLLLADVLLRGRWASTKSARHYIQSGRALLLALNAPPHIVRLARFLLMDVVQAMTLAQDH
jgi:hypothetical protein